MLALTGKAMEGDVLTAVEVIPKSEIQQIVWGKYKKGVRYQWYSATSFHAIASSYLLFFHPIASSYLLSYVACDTLEIVFE